MSWMINYQGPRRCLKWAYWDFTDGEECRRAERGRWRNKGDKKSILEEVRERGNKLIRPSSTPHIGTGS